MKVEWKTNAFLMAECGSLRKFEQGWVMGACVNDRTAIWLNENLSSLHNSSLKIFNVLLHEFLHSLKIPLIDRTIDFLTFTQNRSKTK